MPKTPRLSAPSLDALLAEQARQTERLRLLAARIAHLQPRAPGALALALVRCQGCGGCPHPQWRRAVWRRDRTGRRYLARRRIEASQVRRYLHLAPGFTPALGEAVEEALALCAERHRLNDLIRQLRLRQAASREGR